MIHPNIAEAAIKGDIAAFELIFKQTRDKAYAIALRTTGDAYDAEDVVQDAYISFLKNIATVQDINKLESWLYQIVKNRAVDYLRKNRPEVFSSFEREENENFEFADTIVSEYREFSPEENLDYSETKRIISELLEQLPEKQRICMMQRYSAGMKISEIAEKTGYPEATVKSCLKYGKSKLEEQLKELEKKGTKLYGISGLLLIPFLRWMLGSPSVAEISVQAAGGIAAGATVQAVTSASTSTATAAGTAATSTNANTAALTAAKAAGGAGAKVTAGKIAVSLTTKKVIAGIVAATIVTGGAATAAIVINSKSENSNAPETQMSEYIEPDTNEAPTTEPPTTESHVYTLDEVCRTLMEEESLTGAHAVTYYTGSSFERNETPVVDVAITYSYSLPQLLLLGPDTDAFNQHIQEKYIPIAEEMERISETGGEAEYQSMGEEMYCDNTLLQYPSISYSAVLTDQILTIRMLGYPLFWDWEMSSNPTTLEIFNFNIETGEQLDTLGVAACIGYSEDEYYALLRDSIQAYYQEKRESGPSYTWESNKHIYSDECIQRSTTEERLREAELYIGEDGCFYAKCLCFMNAGAGDFYVSVKLQNTP